MTETIDTGFQRALAKECVDEILKAKATSKEGIKGIADLMKKYEEKIFDQHYRKPVIAPVPVPVQAAPQQTQQTQQRVEATSPGLSYPFISGSSYPANYPSLQTGYNPNINPQAQFQQQPQFQPQLQPQQQFQDPRLQPNPVSYQPQPGAHFLQGENLYYNDPNAKFHLPQGYDPNYSNTYINRPLNDVSNQPQFLNPQAGIPNAFGLHNQVNPFPNQGYQVGLGGNPPPEKNPYYQSQENQRLSKNIEMLGGIERTIPNMQMSLNNNELRNIEQNYRFQGQHDTGNYRLNSLLQSSMANAQYDQQNIRGASPARGEYFNQYEAQYLRGDREDPQLSHRNQLYQSPNRNYGTDPDLHWNPYTNARSRDPSQERRPNSARKTGLSSSKDLRSEKAELLGWRYQTPAATHERDYYN